MDGCRAHRWLLIGNSRWHWAEARTEGLRIWHTPPAASFPFEPEDLRGWAASGPVSATYRLPPERRLRLGMVPLEGAPPWLGIDRALAGWLAWRQTGRAVLVADAGTILSLTRVDARGRFRGGRLMAGAALQLRAMAAGTAALPAVETSEDPCSSSDLWPKETREAMVVGVLRGLAAAIAQAAAQFRSEEPEGQLILTGGDSATAEALVKELLGSDRPATIHWPDLPLQALVKLKSRGE